MHNTPRFVDCLQYIHFLRPPHVTHRLWLVPRDSIYRLTRQRKKRKPEKCPAGKAGAGLGKRKSKSILGRGCGSAPVSGWIFFRCWNRLGHGQGRGMSILGSNSAHPTGQSLAWILSYGIWGPHRSRGCWDACQIMGRYVERMSILSTRICFYRCPIPSLHHERGLRVSESGEIGLTLGVMLS